DRCHATGLDAPRADGGARPTHRFLPFGHEARRPQQTGQRHARESRAAEISMWPALVVDPMLHVARLFHFHFSVSFVRNSSSGHGFSGATGAGLPVMMTTVPSGLISMRATSMPAVRACWITFGLRFLVALSGLRFAKYSSSACLFRSEKKSSS